MSRVDLITIYPDQTFSETKAKVVEDHLKVRGHNPKLVAGKNVFPQRMTSIWHKLGLKRRKRLVIWNHGAEQCFENDENAGRLDDHWNTTEAEAYINKIIAWAAAKTKLFSKFEVYVFWILLGALLIMNILMLRRIGI